MREKHREGTHNCDPGEIVGFGQGLGETMKASCLGLLVLASFLLLLTALSEGAPPVSAAPEVVTPHSEHLPIEASALSKAWWKKFILESGSQKQPRTPRPGVFSPLSANDPK